MEDVYLESGWDMGLRRNGFTLIELLVVIAIIALLLSIMMPALGKAKEKAETSICAAHLKQFGLAWYFYAEDNDGKNIEYIYGPGKFWFYQLATYFQDEEFAKGLGNSTSGVMKILVCPSAKPWSNPYNDNLLISPKYGTAKIAWQWTTITGGNRHEGGYALNAWMQEPPTTAINIDYYYQKYDDAKGSVPLISDGGWVDAWPSSAEALEAPNLIDLQGAGLPGTTYRLGSSLTRLILARHGKGINILFKDTSVQRIKLQKVWSFPWHNGFETVPELDLPSQ